MLLKHDIVTLYFNNILFAHAVSKTFKEHDVLNRLNQSSFVLDFEKVGETLIYLYKDDDTFQAKLDQYEDSSLITPSVEHRPSEISQFVLNHPYLNDWIDNCNMLIERSVHTWKEDRKDTFSDVANLDFKQFLNRLEEYVGFVTKLNSLQS